MAFEFSMLDFIRENISSGFMDSLMIFFTKLGDKGIFWILLAVVLLAVPKTRKLGAVMAVSLILDLLCCNIILKPIVRRIRPYDLHSGISLLVPKPTDYSFPSGHTAASFASVSALYYGKCRYWILTAILALLIAFSRLYLYVHYPTDVLGGMVVGWLVGRPAGIIVDKLQAKLLEKKAAGKTE